MLFGDRVRATTQELMLPKVVDNVLNSNLLPLRLIGAGKPGAGRDIKIPIKYLNSGTAASFAGLDTFSASQLDTKVRMTFDMRGVRQPVALAGMEMTANAVSQTQVINLLKESFEETEQELAQAVGTQLYSTGQGNGNKDLLGLGAAVDDGTTVAVYGGLSRTTYPVIDATVTASGGTLSLQKLATLYSAISAGSDRSTPTMGITTETVWDLYDQLLTPTVREQYTSMGNPVMAMRGGPSRPMREDGLAGTAGFVALTYRGVGIVRDENCTAQTFFLLNENYLQWYGWDAPSETNYNKVSLTSTTIDGLYAESPMSAFTGFNWSGFQTPVNQFGVIADVILLGNLTCSQPRRQGKLTGVTGV